MSRNAISFPALAREYTMRECRHRTQREVAQRMGINHAPSLNAILLGKSGRVVRLEHLDAAARSEGVPLSEFLTRLSALALELEQDTEHRAPNMRTPKELVGKSYVRADLDLGGTVERYVERVANKAKRSAKTPRRKRSAGAGDKPPKDPQP